MIIITHYSIAHQLKQMEQWSKGQLIEVILTKVEQISVTPHKETGGAYGTINPIGANG